MAHHQKRRPLEERFWEKVDRSGGPDSCWIWTGAKRAGGYGHFRLDVTRGSIGAHRVAYELSVGPIPDGLEIDHLCVNPPCVNPSHLEPVTQAENTRRIGERMTACRRGHPWVSLADYRVRPNGRRACRECARTGQRQRRATARAAA